MILNHLNCEKYQYEINYRSAGIFNMPGKPMHKLSKKFLIENSIPITFHSSNTLNDKKVSWADLIYFLDFDIYDNLTKQFPKHKKKFQLLGKYNNGLIIQDPIKMSKKEYALVMKNLYTSCQLTLEKFKNE